MLDNLICPISMIKIDRNVVRTNGLITTVLLIAYVFTRSPVIIVPIALDYVLRAMLRGPTSPMTHLARVVARAAGLKYRAVDKASKVFASRIGVCFAMTAAITHFAAPSVAPVIAGTLAIFTTLESVFDLCVGCVVYTYIALPFYRAREAVQSISLFKNLDEPTLAALADGFQTVELPESATIVKEGELGAEMFIIREGEVEVYRDAPAGPQVIATYKRGEHFGEVALLTGARREASVRARTPVTALRLRKVELDELLAKHETLRATLERTAADRLAREASSSVASP